MAKQTQSKKDAPQPQDIKVPLANLKVGEFSQLDTYSTQLIAIYRKKGEIVTEEMSEQTYRKIKNTQGHRIKAVRYRVPQIKGPCTVSLSDVDFNNTMTKTVMGETITHFSGAHGFELHIPGERADILQSLYDFAHDPKVHTQDFSETLRKALPKMAQESKAQGWAKAEKIAGEMRDAMARKHDKRVARVEKIAQAPVKMTAWVHNELREMANILFADQDTTEIEPVAQPEKPAAKKATPQAKA